MPHNRSLVMVVAAAFCLSAQAQWLDYKTPGIPRTADGKANLSAPTPRLANGKPDFSGVWRDDPASGAATGKAMDALKPQPWADAVAKKRKEELFKDSTSILCLPPGPEIDLGVEKVIQTPNMLVLLYGGGTLYREVFLDGRSLEKEPNPDWMGYSVGHWDGDTLVVESNGYNDRTWLDGQGHPHSEQLRVTERFRRADFGHLEVVRTMTDPGALLEPWTVPAEYLYDPDTEPIEYVCNENERDRGHLVGKASDEKGVAVDPKILEQYTGRYEYHPPDRPEITIPFEIAVEDGHLVMTGSGPKASLISLSATQFSADGVVLDFVKDDQGTATSLIAHIVEGDIKAVRKK